MRFAQRAVEQWMDFCPAQPAMHPYIDKGALQLVEDEEFFALDFRYAYPYHFYRVPTLGGLSLPGGDTVAAYRFHRELLQHLQWNTGRHRWVCKSPSAQHHLDALLDVFPDALCVWAHRPFSEIFVSIVTLTAAVYDSISGKPGNWAAQARSYAEQTKAGLDRLMANTLIDDPRVLHIPFHELAADPAGTVRKVYSVHGTAMSPAFEAQLRRWLDDPENRVDRYGRYPYSYEAFGLDRQWIRELFADYSQRFNLIDKN
jgi:Sulfotransferase family